MNEIISTTMLNGTEEQTLITGGKGGGAARAAVEAPNSLRSATSVAVIDLISEGPIVGVMGGAKGIFLNDTRLQNDDASYNFARVEWDHRVGSASQNYMQGFPSASSEVTVGSSVVVATPIVRTTSDANVDAMIVTIQLPNGLFEQKDNGDLEGTSVNFTIQYRLGAGTWFTAHNATIDGKTMTAYERQYRVERPSGAGTWSVRVTRVTANPPNSKFRSEITWARLTEVQDLKLPYNNTAYVGLKADAETFGNRGFHDWPHFRRNKFVLGLRRELRIRHFD